MTQASPPLSQLSVPRRITPRAKRRAWGESAVRFWWKSALGVAIVAAIVAAGLIRQAREHRRLMEQGIPVTATIVDVEGTSRANFAVQRDHQVPVKLSVPLPDGRTQILDARLPSARGYAKVGADLPIRLDPNDPLVWAEQTEIEPWWSVVAVPVLMMLPIAAALLGIAKWRRRRVLAVWRKGTPARGTVVDVRHSATAPKSRTIRYTIADGTDRRVFTMIYPIRAGIPQPGESLDLLVLADHPKDAIVSQLYAEPPR
jgi:hypothetical protein